jgi:hypothetical protein
MRSAAEERATGSFVDGLTLVSAGHDIASAPLARFIDCYAVTFRPAIFRFRQAFGPFSLEYDLMVQSLAPEPQISLKPRYEGRRHDGHRILGYPSACAAAAFGRRLRALFWARTSLLPKGTHTVAPDCFSPIRGLPGDSGRTIAAALRVRVAMGTALPGFLFPAIRTGALVPHLRRRHRGLEAAGRPAGSETNPTRSVVTYAQSACWPGVHLKVLK